MVEGSSPMCEGVPASLKFQRWFHGSKVVDNNGNPLRVFHGTNKKFDLPLKAFTYFGSSEAANRRTRVRPPISDNGRVYPAFLNIKHPFEFIDHGHDRNADILIALHQHGLIRNRPRDVDVEPEYDDEADEVQHIQNEEEEIVRVLTSHGYDGARFVNSVEDKKSISWICFSNRQIWHEFA